MAAIRVYLNTARKYWGSDALIEDFYRQFVTGGLMDTVCRALIATAFDYDRLSPTFDKQRIKKIYAVCRYFMQNYLASKRLSE